MLADMFKTLIVRTGNAVRYIGWLAGPACNAQRDQLFVETQQGSLVSAYHLPTSYTGSDVSLFLLTPAMEI